MNYIIFSSQIFILILISTCFAQNCNHVLPCMNNNNFNPNTCECDCYPNYSGILCERLDCSLPDPLNCKTYDLNMISPDLLCSFAIIKG